MAVPPWNFTLYSLTLALVEGISTAGVKIFSRVDSEACEIARNFQVVVVGVFFACRQFFVDVRLSLELYCVLTYAVVSGKLVVNR